MADSPSSSSPSPGDQLEGAGGGADGFASRSTEDGSEAGVAKLPAEGERFSGGYTFETTSDQKKQKNL